MTSIVIEKKVLLPIILENKNKHDQIYNEAVSGYWVKAEEILNQKLEKVKAHEKIDNSLGLTFPVNFEHEYDRVIRMLELTSENKIDLTANQFDQYVRNEWSWKGGFVGTNSLYISGAMPLKF